MLLLCEVDIWCQKNKVIVGFFPYHQDQGQQVLLDPVSSLKTVVKPCYFNPELNHLPFKILNTGLSHTIVECTHCSHHTVLDGRCARDVELGQEVVCHRDQRIFWPAGKPVHGAAADQSRELQRTVTKFLTNLSRTNLRYC